MRRRGRGPEAAVRRGGPVRRCGGAAVRLCGGAAVRRCGGAGGACLDGLVVGAGDEVGPVTAREVLDAVDALLVALEGEVRLQRVEAPHLVRVRV